MDYFCARIFVKYDDSKKKKNSHETVVLNSQYTPNNMYSVDWRTRNGNDNGWCSAHDLHAFVRITNVLPAGTPVQSALEDVRD